MIMIKNSGKYEKMPFLGLFWAILWQFRVVVNQLLLLLAPSIFKHAYKYSFKKGSPVLHSDSNLLYSYIVMWSGSFQRLAVVLFWSVPCIFFWEKKYPIQYDGNNRLIQATIKCTCVVQNLFHVGVLWNVFEMCGDHATTGTILSRQVASKARAGHLP